MMNLALNLKNIVDIYLGNIVEKNEFSHFFIGNKNCVLLPPH